MKTPMIFFDAVYNILISMGVSTTKKDEIVVYQL